MRPQSASRADEWAIGALAGQQHGVVGRRQLLDLGFSRRAIGRRIAQGRLHPVHRGVYAVGHRVLTARGRWMAAVLAAAEGATLSHAAAAALWDLCPAGGLTDVTSPRRRSHRGLRIHVARLPGDEITVEDGIPVTTVARTLLDLASVLSRERLRQAIGQAQRRGLADAPSLPDLIARYPGRRGIANLRAVLADRRLGLDVAHSELEIRFIEFLDRRAFPRPELNAILDLAGRPTEVDCLWPIERLVVELDSRDHHADWEAAETDRARDLALLAAGLRCARVTWRKLHHEPDRLEDELRAALC